MARLRLGRRAGHLGYSRGAQGYSSSCDPRPGALQLQGEGLDFWESPPSLDLEAQQWGEAGMGSSWASWAQFVFALSYFLTVFPPLLAVQLASAQHQMQRRQPHIDYIQLLLGVVKYYNQSLILYYSHNFHFSEQTLRDAG